MPIDIRKFAASAGADESRRAAEAFSCCAISYDSGIVSFESISLGEWRIAYRLETRLGPSGNNNG
jgi:hypothetical protein